MWEIHSFYGFMQLLAAMWVGVIMNWYETLLYKYFKPNKPLCTKIIWKLLMRRQKIYLQKYIQLMYFTGCAIRMILYLHWLFLRGVECKHVAITESFRRLRWVDSRYTLLMYQQWVLRTGLLPRAIAYSRTVSGDNKTYKRTCTIDGW